jgi:hypothetical protein
MEFEKKVPSKIGDFGLPNDYDRRTLDIFANDFLTLKDGRKFGQPDEQGSTPHITEGLPLRLWLYGNESKEETYDIDGSIALNATDLGSNYRRIARVGMTDLFRTAGGGSAVTTTGEGSDLVITKVMGETPRDFRRGIEKRIMGTAPHWQEALARYSILLESKNPAFTTFVRNDEMTEAMIDLDLIPHDEAEKTTLRQSLGWVALGVNLGEIEDIDFSTSNLKIGMLNNRGIARSYRNPDIPERAYLRL